ncbi:MAG: TonB-dependent receptor [Myxococcales bacterium]|nr:TonB-dependent receptor [Myxococcales bacterium]
MEAALEATQSDACVPPVLRALLLTLLAGVARAEERDAGSVDAGAPLEFATPPSDAGTSLAPDAGEAETLDAAESEFETLVTAGRDEAQQGTRASTVVRRADLDRRLPRSTPDAVRFEPGVFVQHTAHGQASVFIRGLTGQQTVLLFDGVRLNTSTWRQGPNQYFFTLDSASIDSLEVLRGGASTSFGADALGGVVAAKPLEAPDGRSGPVVRSSLTLRARSADDDVSGRAQLEAAAGPVGFIGGVGGRSVGLLESAGVVRGLSGTVADVPRFLPDGRTQLGTGFKELTFDARATLRLGDRHTLTAALYGYRQFDAPRTDQCPPPGARFDECLTITEQFRTLAYLKWALALNDASLDVTASWQRQLERREGVRPASFVASTGRDVVDSFGGSARLVTRDFGPAEGVTLRARAGADTWVDLVESRAWLSFTDLGLTLERSRGQYLSGSRAATGGGFGELEVDTPGRFSLRAGGRLGSASVDAPGDAESGSLAIARRWLPLAATGGVQWSATNSLTVAVNADHSFRAPNLDDLTSRQQTGPGFQFENPSLAPETATTVEAGAKLRTPLVSIDAWVFQTWLAAAIGRQPRTIADCPPMTPQCAASFSRLQLVNTPGLSDLRGLEVSARLRLPHGLGARATFNATWGEGPNLIPQPVDPAAPWQSRVPLSRIPPLNGIAELSWSNGARFSTAASLQWAGPQDRLAIADLSDARIPLGGTPGFVVVDVRAAVRLSSFLSASLVLENLFDQPWRAHGSSVNGPGRGVMLALTGAWSALR